jgi:hypothetical protein
MSDKVFEQIMAIRKMPDCPNMFDCNAVQVLANNHLMFDLVCFIADDKKAYAEFILTGKRGGDVV